MTSNLTVSDVRANLFSYVTPENEESPKFLNYLNQVRERVINSGKWKGTTFKVNFDMGDREYISLPRDAESLLGLHVNYGVQGIQSRWYEYLVSGPGSIPSPMPDIGSAIDLGDNFATTIDPTQAGILRWKTTATEAEGLTVKVFGHTDQYGNDVYTNGSLGEEITLDSVPVDTTNAFYQITSVVKPVTVGPVQLYVVNGATETLLAEYAPTETRPQYRRYRLANTNYVVTGLCKLKYLPLIQEDEPVIPPSIGALKMGILALVYEDANDPASADAYWGRCYALLNQQLKETRGMARQVFNGSFAAAGLRAIPTTR
jgi:hypothetical protein